VGRDDAGLATGNGEDADRVVAIVATVGDEGDRLIVRRPEGVGGAGADLRELAGVAAIDIDDPQVAGPLAVMRSVLLRT
jgi:hypothetical protein